MAVILESLPTLLVLLVVVTSMLAMGTEPNGRPETRPAPGVRDGGKTTAGHGCGSYRREAVTEW